MDQEIDADRDVHDSRSFVRAQERHIARFDVRKHGRRQRGKVAQLVAAHEFTLDDNVFFPVRYTDDIIILVSGSCQDALDENEGLALHLREELGLELSEEKTKVGSLQDGFAFLGQRARLRWDPRYGLTPRIEIP